MVTTNSSAEDGVATTDTNLAWIVATRPGKLPPLQLWVVISTTNVLLNYYATNFLLCFSRFHVSRATLLGEEIKSG